MATITIDAQTYTHAAQGAMTDTLLMADAKRLGGLENKTFRESYMAGRIAVALCKGQEATQEAGNKALAILTKKGEDRTASEKKAFGAAKTHLHRFCNAHKIKRLQAGKGKGGGRKPVTKTEANTPKATSETAADKYLRTQAATMKAYAEKNKALLPQAWLHLVGEFFEGAQHITPPSDK